jgi:thiol-disulfide isomerase/thioredoxin
MGLLTACSVPLRYRFHVVKIDVSLKSTLCKLYAVRGLPTIIVFKNGDEVIRKSGSLTKNQLVELIK